MHRIQRNVLRNLKINWSEIPDSLNASLNKSVCNSLCVLSVYRDNSDINSFLLYVSFQITVIRDNNIIYLVTDNLRVNIEEPDDVESDLVIISVIGKYRHLQ